MCHVPYFLIQDSKNCPNNGVPDILDWGPDCCDVKFSIPESDRGAKISHYQVEIKENKMNEFTKGPVFTIKEVQEKNGQIHAKIKGIFIISKYCGVYFRNMF